MKRKILLTLFAVATVCLLVLTVAACRSNDTQGTTCIISFNTNGGSEVKSIILKTGDPIVLPDPPTRDGYVFLGWFNDPECKRPVNAAIFKANGNMTIFAGWESVETYPHAITVEEYPEGIVKLVTPEDGRASMGTEVVISIVPGSAYEAAPGGVVAEGNTVSVVLTQTSDTRFVFTMPAEPVTIKVTFALRSHDITVYPFTENGTVALSAYSARQGDIITARPLPDYGYRLTELYMYSAEEGSRKTITNNFFVMPAGNVIIGATFEPIDYEVYYDIECVCRGNGVLRTEFDRQAAGLFVKYEVIPEPGNRLVSLMSDGAVLDDGGFIMPAEDVVLTAVFAETDDDDLLHPLTLTASDGVVATSDGRTEFAAGEAVTLILNPLTGYEIGGVTVNGSYTEGDTFLMPNEQTVVVAEFVKRGYSVEFASDNMNFTGSVSAVYAYEGDLIVFDVQPLRNYFVTSVSLKIIGEDENPVETVPLTDDYFIMPAADVIIEVVATAINNKPVFSVTAEACENGQLSFSLDKARYGDTVTVTATPEEGYRLKAGSISLSYYSQGNHVTVSTGSAFRMPDSDVTVRAQFERVYRVSSIDEYNISVFPSVTEMAVGEEVMFTANTRGDYIYGTIVLTVSTASGYTAPLDGSGVFLMTAENAGDVYISYDESAYSKVDASVSKSFDITVKSVNGGYIEIPKTYGVAYGTVVPIKVVPSEGYALKSIVLTTRDLSYTVGDAFTMPMANVTLTAEFEEKTAAEFTLQAIYERNRDSFRAAGIFMKYYRESYQIRELFGQSKVNPILSYVDGVITATSEYGHDFYVIEVKSLVKLTAISQRAVDRIRADYSDNDRVDVLIDYNFIIVSVNGDAEEDKQMLLNGIKRIDNCILYGRKDGSYGLYAYFGTSAYVNIMPVYSGRAISYIAPYAFAVRGAGIEGISLGNATILDDFALSGLKNIRYVYLGNASYVGEGAFAGCYALEHISVSANNSAYMTDAQGALYEITSNKYKLVAYPSGNTATTYAINSKCGAVMPYAFYGADSLEYVSYGGTLAEIGEYAFSDCAALKAIYYTNTPSSSVIAGVADFNVTNSSVGYIGAHAFAGCDLLNTYRFDNIAFLGEYAVDWDGASDITIYLNVSALCASDGIAVELPDGAGGVTGRLTIHAGDLCEEYSAAKYWSELRAYIVE